MPDLALFRMNRAPTRVDPNTAQVLPVAPGARITRDTEGNGDRALIEGNGSNSEENSVGPFLGELLNLVLSASEEGGGIAMDYVPSAAYRMAAAFLHPLPADLLNYLLDPAFAPVPPRKKALQAVTDLDRWLLRHDDGPTPDELDAMLVDLVAALNDIPKRQVNLDKVVSPTHGPLWIELVDLLCAALLIPDQWRLAQRVTRLLLVAALSRWRSEIHRKPNSSSEIQGQLRSRTPLLPSPPFPQVISRRRVELVRQATVSDLFVVRNEWRCYVAGEVADITNVLRGEKLEHSVLSIDEREITQTAVDETATTEQRAQETTDRTELSEETQSQVNLAVHVQGQVEVAGKYGTTKVDATVGGSVDYSRSDAMHRATRVAHEAVMKASTTVEKRARRERVERLLARTEKRDGRTLDNSAHNDRDVRGVYRWVDRIDRFQVIRYPDRFQLEFQLPEPGNSLRRLLMQPPPSLVPDPGEFTTKVEDITRESWKRLADEAKVIGVRPPPEPTVAVTASLFGAAENIPKDGSTTVWNPPGAKANADIIVPPGYKTTNIKGNIRGEPMMAKWHREMEGHDGFDEQEAFHALHLILEAGEYGLLHWWNPMPETNDQNANSIMRTKNPGTQLMMAGDGADFDQSLTESIRDKLPVVVRAEGGLSVTARVVVECTLTDEAYGQWQAQVFDTLLNEHEARVREFRDEQARNSVKAGTVRERSPAANAQLIRDELKREIVAWLCDEIPFGGRPATLTPPVPPIDGIHYDEHPDLAKATAVAPDIQFLEQAFEWQNIVYVCYPYYWADPVTWDARRLIEAGDVALAQFLQAGSVRAVVPARHGFQDAVTHWLLFRQPWSGSLAAPLPGQDLYVSVAQEIKDQLVPPEDGEPGESWEVRLPTPFQWLEDPDKLPHNEQATLGAPPNAPKHPLCPDLNHP